VDGKLLIVVSKGGMNESHEKNSRHNTDYGGVRFYFSCFQHYLGGSESIFTLVKIRHLRLSSVSSGFKIQPEPANCLSVSTFWLLHVLPKGGRNAGCYHDRPVSLGAAIHGPSVDWHGPLYAISTDRSLDSKPDG
jgi:hypothetical protein